MAAAPTQQQQPPQPPTQQPPQPQQLTLLQTQAQVGPPAVAAAAVAVGGHQAAAAAAAQAAAGPLTVAHASSGLQVAAQAQDFDPVQRFRLLLPQLKESLQNLMKVAAQNFVQNTNIDSGQKSNDGPVQRVDKSLEEFYALCDQLELCLSQLPCFVVVVMCLQVDHDLWRPYESVTSKSICQEPPCSDLTRREPPE
ncbi:mediator of RNA polymerase II transcription subunit 29 isoform X3 [Rhineura floridana]|uniref:mediator of RNA polymerase II transcription subunit 29 isoform X3 n=1 Tax=Rhineura floridana TaxID=261503 RepID=UPI002AC868C8|nr:mediator of RNA polymerase II transcription subunit 29 isoform X3 [Rhineura floridana]